ncbi:Kelch repeat-containing protein [Streptomyces sp. NRRL S-646]|uniref:Kelch repeat-containing protein n=1 Tax=Streptomyces sp. NRRL S-646 TaxID=1463917 RepID=UPI0004C8E919|nr:kelch repeat-containing protein [Streptomyces sp. NRRL S-646]
MTSPTLAATGAWTKTGDLPAAASWYGQCDGPVLLKNDKGVLLAGGADAKGVAVNTTAVYNPTAKTWTAGRTLQFPRRLHTVTLLDSGKVLVVGGTSGSSPLSPSLTSVELYDPADGSWKAVASLREARRGHHAILLANHKVLVTGGLTTRSGDSAKALATAEIYDPDADTWTPTKQPMTDARTGHSGVLFKGGQVLVAGGTAPISGADAASLAFCELYNPTADTWTPAGNLLQPRSRHQLVLASDTTALVVGGATPGTPGDGTFDPFTRLTVERYDLATDKWTARAASPGGRGFHRVVPLRSGTFLVAGGTADEHNGVGYQSALIYDNATDTWTAAAGLTTGRWAFAAAALADGKALVTGGTVVSGIAGVDPDTAQLSATTEVFALGGAS